MTAPAPTRQELRTEVRLVRRLLLGAGVGALAWLPFLGLLLVVRTGAGPLASLDGELADALNGWARSRPGAVDVLELLSDVTSPWTFRVLVLVVAAALWRFGRRRLATWAAVTMAVGGLLGGLLKLLVGRARPQLEEPVAAAAGLSFPSGHALNSMLGTAVLLLLLLPHFGRTGRALCWTLGGLAVAVTAFDRVALGVHFLTDVLAGWSAALAVVAGTATAFGTWRREHPVTDDHAAARDELALRAAVRQLGQLLGRALVGSAGLVALMVALGLLVTEVLTPSAALADLNTLPRRLAEARSPALDTLSDVLSRLADTGTVVPTMLAVCGVLRLVFGRWREAAFVAMAVSVQALVFVTTQLVVARARPDVVQLDVAAPTSSFPSGHTSAAVALYGSLAVVLLWRNRSAALRAAAVVLLLVPAAVAWSRLYRGLHFPLDIAGSYVQAGLAVLLSARLVLLARVPQPLASVLDGGVLDGDVPDGADVPRPPG